MNPDKEKSAPEDEPKKDSEETRDVDTATDNSQPESILQEAPADALSRTPDDLAEEQQAIETASSSADTSSAKPKKVSKLRLFLKRINVYLLMFILIVVVSFAIVAVYYLNSQKPVVVPGIENQELTEESLRDLANKDASVGNASQTLTIQGNAIIDGQTLMRGNLNIAGNLQTGGSIQGPSLTISGTSNLGTTQANSLQVATNFAVQGTTTLQDLSVTGSSTFNGPVTVSQLTATRLVLSGNAVLEIPNHITFTGPTPSFTTTASALGSGGSASISGSDTSGTINVNTGNSPAAGCFIRVNFNQNYSNAPRVIISPASNAAGRTQHYVERDRSGFSVCTANPAPGNQSLIFDFFAMN